MDKSKPAPPMPKLPDPPQEEKQSGVRIVMPTGREKILVAVAGVLLLAFGVWFILFAIQSGRSPRQAVDRFGGEELAVQEEVLQVSLPDQIAQRSAYFYISNDQMACALLERGAAGYKVLDAAGQMPLTAQGKQGVWKLLGGRKEIFVFGILYDTAVTQVEVNGQPTVMVDNGMYRCWYFYSVDAMSIDSESVAYLRG